MIPFQKLIICDTCGYPIHANDVRVRKLKEGDLEVQYFICPTCRTKYHILTTDSKMRDLIDRREVIQTKIKAAHTKQFRKRTIEKYMREYEQLKKKQEKMFPSLKERGEKILIGRTQNE